MRTLILSDLHLGNGGELDTFAGGEALPALLDSLSGEPIHVILNGDTIDFLMNEAPLELDVARAVEQARASVAWPVTQSVLEALGRVLARGGEVTVRLGNHDAELALAEVQAVVRGALGQPEAIAQRLAFQRGEAPAILDVGGARLLVTHGEHIDNWNRLDYRTLPGPQGPAVPPSGFTYPPGSRLVKTLLNPLKVQFGMRFADLLKPDFQGAVMTVLAVNPIALKIIFQGSTLSLLWQLFRQMRGAATFDEAGEEDLGLASALDEAGLTEEERAKLMEVMDPNAPAAFDEADEAPDSILSRARVKIGRAGLRFYARQHKWIASKAGDLFFQIEPGEEEWKEARRLADKFGVNAVVVGHTHAARWRHEENLTFVNTGTWITLMQLPPASASEDQWQAFLETCRKNPMLDPSRGETAPLLTRFTAALAEPDAAGGARLALIEWQPGVGLVTRESAHVPAAARAE